MTVQYVMDASVIIEYLVLSQNTSKVRGFFGQLTDDDTLIIPEFCLLECANVLWKHIRFHGMRPDTSFELLDILKQMPLKSVMVSPILNQALQIAIQHGLAVYDSCYIALALSQDYPLISLDQPQIRAASYEGVKVIGL
jgi:predicted nucleic acid-binding protein